MRRLALAAALVALTAVLTIVVGWPDPRRSLELLTGADATSASESALIGLLCWLAVATMAAAAVGSTIASARHVSMHKHRFWSVAVLVLGAVLLAIGITRHAGGYRVCCATPVTATQAQQLVH